MTRELLEGELSFSDQVIADILADAEKYQDVIKDLSSDAISATMKKLAVTSEEFKAGADILGSRAYGMLYDASDEIYDEIDKEAFGLVIDTDKARAEADDEIDTSLFDIERKASLVLIETNARIDELIEGIEDKQNDFWRTLEQNLNIIFDSLWEPIWEWFPELEADVTYQLAALPAVLLFEAFKNFFFEED